MQNNDNFLLNIVNFSWPTLITLLIGVIAIPLLSYIYPADEYAKINMFYTVGNMFYIIAFLGLDNAYLRFYYEMQHAKLFYLALMVGLFVNIICFVFIYICFSDETSQFFFGEQNHWALWVLFIYVTGLIIFRIVNLSARLDQNPKLYGVQQVTLNVITRFLYAVVAVYSTYYFYSITFMAAMTIFCGIVFFCHNYNKFCLPSYSLAKNLFAFSIPLMPASLLLWFNNSIVKIIVSSMGNFDMLGVLAMAQTLTSAIAAIPGAFGIYWGPFMYQNYKTAQTFIKRVHDIMTLICVLLCVALILSQDIIYMFIGPIYRASQPYFMLLLLSPIGTALCETTSYGIILAKKTYISLIISLVTCIINAVLCWFLLKQIGILGAPISVAISAIFQMFVRTVTGQYYYSSISTPTKTLLGWLVLIIVCIANLFIHDKVALRILFCSVILYTIFFNYKSETMYIVKKIKMFFILAKRRNFDV